MEITDISNSLLNAFELSMVSQNEWEIKSQATFNDGSPIQIFLETDGKTWQLTDKKNTLSYMNNLYDLKASDVKNCISAVIKIYGFNISAGILKAELTDEYMVCSKIFDFIMCIGQLSNMFAFFDKL